MTHAPAPDSVEPILRLLDHSGRPFPFRADRAVPQARIDVAAELVTRWARPWVMRWALREARRIDAGRAEAEDMTSEVILSLWQALPDFDQQRGKLCTYLKSCARNRLRSLSRSHVRRRRREMVASLDASSAVAAVASDDHIADLLLHRILDRPLDYLSARDAALLAVLHGPAPTPAKAGFAHDSGYSRALARLRARIREIVREEMDG